MAAPAPRPDHFASRIGHEGFAQIHLVEAKRVGCANLCAMLHETRDQEASPEVNDPFRILALYDSAKTSAQAARASAVVVRELGEDVPVDRCSWNIRALDSEATRGFAAGEAARADLIVIALSCDSLSTVLKDWVKQWEKKRTLSGGLLALIPAEECESAATLEDYFYEIAITANMDFLCRKQRRY